MRSIYTLALIILLSSCQGGIGVKKDDEKTAINQVTSSEIEQLEKDFFAKAKLNAKADSKKLLNAYDLFVKQNPEDNMSPEYLFNAANVLRSTKNYTRAISYYERIVKEYPDFKLHTESHFLIGFIYDNDLHDKSMAKKVYTEVASLYPDERFGKDAKNLLELIDFTDEQLQDFLDKKNK